MEKDFKFYGTGRIGDGNNNLIDLKEAESCFNKCKREILDVFMLKNGFKKYKSMAYVRLNNMCFVEYIDLQKEHYGSKTFTVNISKFPLYIPLRTTINGEPILPLIGKRLGDIIDDKEFWWNYCNYEVASKSFMNVIDGIDKFLFPWFLENSDEQLYLDKMLKCLFKDGSKIKEITYLHLKNNQIQLAKDFLDYLQSNFNIELPEKRKTVFNNSIKSMIDLLNSIDSANDYINSIIEKNINDLKLPINLER